MTIQPLNAWLDRLPRSHLMLGDRAVPVYLATGLAGVVCGLLVHLLLAAAMGISVAAALAISTVSCAGFVSYGLLRRRLTGREETVLLEHLFLALGLGAGLCLLLSVPLRPHIDAQMVGLCVFLAWGRLGCTIGGCCYGRASSCGIRYPQGHAAHPHRRLPVQLIELGTWVGLAIAGTAVALLGPRGAASGSVLIAYAVVRFALEGLRGDRRPHFLALSQSRWMAGLAVVIGLALAAAPGWPTWPDTLAGVVGVLGATALWVTRGRWIQLRAPVTEAMLDGAVSVGRRLAEVDLGPAVRTWTDSGLVYAASVVEEDDTVRAVLTLSRPGQALVDAEAALLVDALSTGLAAPLGRPAPVGLQGLWAVELPSITSREAGPRLVSTARGAGRGYFERR